MRLGAYQLIQPIGAGGMGEVWVATRPLPDGEQQRVAIKRLPQRFAGDPSYRRILLEEARLSQLLSHPNIVHTIDAGEAEGEVYIAMELIDGLDLSRVNKLLAAQGERLSASVAAYIVAEVLRGLAYAHNLEHEGELISLVHRDVSPHNVMLSTTGAVKLTDFGVARLSSEDTSGTHVKGKARYMPPEQLRGESRSPGVDLFAAGAVLQELLDGCLFRATAIDDARLLGMAIDGEVPPPLRPREIPPELEQLRRRLLDPDPAKRPRSAERALDLLHRWAGYRDRSGEVAALTLRLRGLEAELVGQGTQTGLAHQATFLHTNELELELGGSELLEMIEAPDQILLALDSRRARPSPPPPPSSDPSLTLDLAGESLVDRRPARLPTSASPAVDPRSGTKLLGLGLAIVGSLAVGGWLAGRELGWFTPTGDEHSQAPASTLRSARVIGRGSALDRGLRARAMDRLLDDDILFDYVVDGRADPLEVLARDEAEFAVTTVDALTRERAAGRPGGTIVAVVGLPLATAALVLDTVDHPKLVDLAALLELEPELRAAQREPAIASSPASEPFARALAATLASLDPDRLARTLELEDDAAVFAELEREGSPVVAGFVHEPWVSKARAAGMTVAATALDLPLAHVEVLVASARVLAADPELVAAVVTTYYASVDRLPGEAGPCLLDAPGAAPWFGDDDAALLADLIVEPRFVLAAAQADRADRAAPAELGACLAAASSGPLRTRALGPLARDESLPSPFQAATASLNEHAAANIAELATTLRQFNPATISAQVVGYGEQPGGAGRKLGRARAEQLIEALVAAGVTLPLRPVGRDKREAPRAGMEILLDRAE